jgi:pimeloyl-ACP methyl ester carboxylesterase
MRKSVGGKGAVRSIAARTLAPLVDAGIKAALLSRSKASRARSSAESLGPRERAKTLRQIAALYDRTEHFTHPETFFGVRRVITPTVTRVRGGAGLEVLDVAWPSAEPTFVAELDAKYRASTANRTAHARLFRGRGERRPVVVMIHGYLGGAHAFEERAWPVRALVERGLDVALFVLPFHGPRGGRRRPAFPASDPRLTVEGFRQAIGDLDAFVGWLRHQGAPHVGVMGMSLGGYTAALAATTLPDVDFAAPYVPLASIADFARADGRFVGTDEDQDEQHRLLENAHAVVSPLSRSLRTPRERTLVIAGERDRITPITHAEKLAEHFGVPLLVMPGGHLVQVGRGDAFRHLLAMLRETGVLR